MADLLKYQLAIFLLLVSIQFNFGFILGVPDFWYLERFNQNPERNSEGTVNSGTDILDPLWVLDLELNMFDSLKLRKANDFEKKDFEKSVGPLIERAKNRTVVRRPPSIGRTQDSHSTSDSEHDNKGIVAEIMAAVNKFIISAVGVDIDSQMPETTDVNNTPSLALYLKGPYSAVILKYGRTEWKFFFSYPSPLPDWFYEDHNDCLQPHAKYLPVPQYVENEFYATFSQLLKLFFRVEM